MTAHIQEDFAPNEDDLEVERVNNKIKTKKLKTVYELKWRNFRLNPSPRRGCPVALGQQMERKTLLINSSQKVKSMQISI